MTETPDDVSVVRLSDGPLSWSQYEKVVYGAGKVELGDTTRMILHRAELERQVSSGAVIYSVNTGYGADAGRTIPTESIGRMQANTLRSTSLGVGEAVPVHISRGMMLVKAQAYAQGPPALRPIIAERLIEFLNGGITPVVYEKGSQSASGDLIPNAHIGLGLMGEGDVWSGGRRLAAAEAGVSPLVLEMKEGVALTNDVSFSVALGVDVIRAAQRLVERAEDVAAMTLQALRGFPDAYDERLVRCRPHPGVIESARHMRSILEGSSLVRDQGRRHDPYSLRCLPQVHGAVRDAISHARAAAEIELQAIGDNPLVFPDDQLTISGGNIHGAPIGLPLDGLATAVATLAALSQRRTHHLVNPIFDVGLPPKLAPSPDEHFGLLMANNAAASLVSECAALSYPASVTSIGIDEMEDHVSMAALAAQKTRDVLIAARRVFTLELLCAAQGLDFQGVGNASPSTQRLHRTVRDRVPFVRADTPIATQPLEDLL